MQADSPSPMFLRVSLKAFQRLRKEVPDFYNEMVNEVAEGMGVTSSAILKKIQKIETGPIKLSKEPEKKLSKNVSDFLLAFLFASMLRSPTWEQTVSDSANKRKQMRWKEAIIKDMGLKIGGEYYTYDPENPELIPPPLPGAGWNGGNWTHLYQAVREGNWNYIKSDMMYEDRAYVFNILNRAYKIYDYLINWEYAPIELKGVNER